MLQTSERLPYISTRNSTVVSGVQHTTKSESLRTAVDVEMPRLAAAAAAMLLLWTGTLLLTACWTAALLSSGRTTVEAMDMAGMLIVDMLMVR